MAESNDQTTPDSAPVDTDTIAAIATARGQSALAVVRISGVNAVDVAASVFAGKDLREVAANVATFGRIRTENDRSNQTDDQVVDQVVATVFRAPHSSTGEDLVEITCHGGDVAARLVLRALLDAGARMAEPGEFTQRAFLNNKLDLAQAEAVADLIHASSSAAHRVSVAHLEGRYSERLNVIRDELLELAALVELELDFSDEDVEFADKPRLQHLLLSASGFVEELLGSYRSGTMIRDGVRVVIAGRPNAGKSTLLNALVGRDRAIVSDTPGTTRDEIESEAEIDGVRFVFTDTAGLRETGDTIEAEGVRRSEAAVRRADVLLYVYDVTEGLADDERLWLHELAGSNNKGDNSASPLTLVVANKSDLVDSAEHSVEHSAVHSAVHSAASSAPAESESAGPHDTVTVCATAARRDTVALNPVTDWLRERVTDALTGQDASGVIMNERHLRHLRAASGALRRAAETLDYGGSGDVLAVDLREALQELGAITGAITNEDVLDQVFSRFCIGK